MGRSLPGYIELDNKVTSRVHAATLDEAKITFSRYSLQGRNKTDHRYRDHLISRLKSRLLSIKASRVLPDQERRFSSLAMGVRFPVAMFGFSQMGEYEFPTRSKTS